MLRHKVDWLRNVASLPIMVTAMVTAAVCITSYRTALVVAGRARLRDWNEIQPPRVLH